MQKEKENDNLLLFTAFGKFFLDRLSVYDFGDVFLSFFVFNVLLFLLQVVEEVFHTNERELVTISYVEAVISLWSTT